MVISTRLPQGSRKSRNRPSRSLHPHLLEGPAHELLVVDRDAEVPVVVGPLPAPPGEVDELVPEVDEGGVLAPPRNLEVQEPAVEGEGLVDVPDLEGDVVDADGSGLADGAVVAHWADSRLASGTAGQSSRRAPARLRYDRAFGRRRPRRGGKNGLN